MINSSITIGLTIARIFGVWLVNNGRRSCILISAFIAFVAIIIMLVENIWIFIIGRFLYGISAGIYFSVCNRFIEECSPP